MTTAIRKAIPIIMAIAICVSFTGVVQPVSAATKPAKVKLVSAKAVSHSQILLKWNKVKGAKGYEVFRNGKKIKNIVWRRKMV